MNSYKTKYAFLLILILFFSASVAQDSSALPEIDIDPAWPKDSVVLLVGQMESDGRFMQADSIQKALIYSMLDSLRLHTVSLKLVETELQACPADSLQELLHLNTRKACILLSLGNYPEAGSLFRANVENAKSLSQERLSINYGGLAMIFHNQAELDSAHKYSDLFLQMSRELKDTNKIAEALKIKGNLYWSAGDYRASLQTHLQAEGYCDSSLLGSLYNEIGRDYYYLKEDDSAFLFMQKAIGIRAAIGDSYGSCVSLGNIGQLYFSMNRMTEAWQYFDSCEHLAHSYNYMDMVAWMKKAKSTFCQKAGDYKEALTYYQSYSIISEELISDNNDVRFAIEKARSNAAFTRQSNRLLLQEREVDKLRNLRMTYVVLALSLLVLITVLSIIIIRLNARKRNLELRQRLKRMQMNPHFIFNSLNHLQQHILQNDVVASNRYLNRFSGLMRTALENSLEDLVPFAQEVDFIKKYLELEAMRFDERFQWKLELDEHLQTQSLKIPSMLLQPFIENAIWHGLLPKQEGQRLLEISFKLKDDVLQCEIRDNGIGRERSWQIRKKEQKDKKSLGIDISRQRLEALSKIYAKPFRMAFVDLKEGAEARGTMVRLEFPKIV